jgi:hypothetical protein
MEAAKRKRVEDWSDRAFFGAILSVAKRLPLAAILYAINQGSNAGESILHKKHLTSTTNQ